MVRFGERFSLSRFLSRRLVAIVAACALALLSVFAVEYQFSRDELIDSSLDRIAAVASTLALQVDGQAHERLVRMAPARDAFVVWGSAPLAHQAMHALFRQVEHTNGLGTPVYSLRLREEHAAAVRAAPDRLHPDAMEFIVTSAENPYWRHTYDYRPEMGPTLLEGRPARVDVYEDVHGSWISAYAPIVGGVGAMPALVEVDQRLDRFQTELQMSLARRWSVEVGVVALVLLLLTWGVVRTLRAVRELESSAFRLSAGDFQTPVQSVVEGPAAALARSIERARSEVRDKTRAEHEARVRAMFMARMSHEIRTPMNGVLGLARVLGDTPLDAEQRRLAADIYGSANQLLEVTNQILDLARLDAEAIPVSTAHFDLPRLVEHVGAAGQASLGDRPVELSVAIEPAAPRWVTGDPTRVRQVLGNLVSNATRFTEQGRIELTVAVAQTEERTDEQLDLRFSVADTGPGIPAHLHDAIFEPFHRGHAPGPDDEDRPGLGLAVTREIVRALGGRIDLVSAPGAGSTFTVCLPLGVGRAPAERLVERSSPPADRALLRPVSAPPADGSIGRASTAAPDGAASSASSNASSTPSLSGSVSDVELSGRGALSGRILVADDNKINRLVAERSVQKLGCAVQSFDDGDTALEAHLESPFDCLLLDMNMPRMTGLQVVEALRARGGAVGEVPVLIVSAGMQPEERTACEALGVRGFVGKPFTLTELHGALADCMHPVGGYASPRSAAAGAVDSARI